MRRFYFLLHANGIGTLIRTERNFQIHLVVGAVVCCFGWYFKISAKEWYILLAVSVLVLIAEAFNTALEKLCDVVSPDYHPGIKIVKDIGAGAVLLSAVFAIVCGVLVFWKYVF